MELTLLSTFCAPKWSVSLQRWKEKQEDALVLGAGSVSRCIRSNMDGGIEKTFKNTEAHACPVS